MKLDGRQLRLWIGVGFTMLCFGHFGVTATFGQVIPFTNIGQFSTNGSTFSGTGHAIEHTPIWFEGDANPAIPGWDGNTIWDWSAEYTGEFLPIAESPTQLRGPFSSQSVMTSYDELGNVLGTMELKGNGHLTFDPDPSASVVDPHASLVTTPYWLTETYEIESQSGIYSSLRPVGDWTTEVRGQTIRIYGSDLDPVSAASGPYLVGASTFTISGAFENSNPLNLGEPNEISTVPGVVWSPTVAPNGLELYYTRWLNNSDWDIHWASRDEVTKPWRDEGPVPSLVVPGNQDRVTLSGDGLTMVFGSGTWELYSSQRNDLNSEWQEPTRLALSDLRGTEGAPNLSLDGMTLYFGGGWDHNGPIRVATRESTDAEWSDATTLAGFEDISANYPTISPDGLTMFYARTETGNGYNVWAATRDSIDQPFGNHVQLSDEFNTPNEDFPGSFTADGILYFNRDAIRGEDTWRLSQTGPAPLFDRTDLNFDGLTDSSDADHLCNLVRRGRFESQLDLNGDGVMSSADMDVFLEDFGTLAGDFNLDGAVEFDDFLILSNSFGRTGQYSRHGNANCDDATDFADFLILSKNFGRSVVDGNVLNQANALTASSVPEPDAMALFFIGMASIRCLRRRAKR